VVRVAQHSPIVRSDDLSLDDKTARTEVTVTRETSAEEEQGNFSMKFYGTWKKEVHSRAAHEWKSLFGSLSRSIRGSQASRRDSEQEHKKLLTAKTYFRAESRRKGGRKR
jgi:hypothetical protein